MAEIKIYESAMGRSISDGDNGQGSIHWTVLGTTNELVAKALVRITTPATFEALFLQTVEAKPTSPDSWDCEARYGRKDSSKESNENNYKFSFDTTGGRQKITQSLESVVRYGKDGVGKAADHKGAIGVTEHGVDGCEIVVPKFAWSETWELPIVAYGWAYAQRLKAITGRVNATWFRGFPKGQVLFHGGKGSASTKDPKLIEITFSFEQNDDVGPLTIGDIKDVNKLGWQYLWVHYVEALDTGAKALARQPDGVYIERVYDTANFGVLGIGM